MNNLNIKAGSVDISVVIRIINSTNGTPETGVVFNTAGIDLQYRREGAASVAILEATLAALTTAHTDGGFLHIGNGYYRLDLPDAAVATGAAGVLVHGTVTGMVVIGCYIQLVAYDPFDTVRLGLTALPNAAAEAAGGLYTRGVGAGQINQPANGQIDANVESWNATSVPAEHTAGYPIVTVKDGIGTGEIDTASGRVAITEAQIDQVVDEVWDELKSAHIVADSFGDYLDNKITSRASQTSLNTLDDFVDTEVAAIKAKTDQLTFTNANKLDASILAVADFAAAVANKIADHVLRRTYANARASSDGDTYSFRSLMGAIAKLVNKWTISGSTLTIYHEDDATSAGSQGVTGTAGADPITTLDTN